MAVQQTPTAAMVGYILLTFNLGENMSATDSTYINEQGDLTQRITRVDGERVSSPDKLSEQVIVRDADGNTHLAKKVDSHTTIDEIPGLRAILDNLGITDADLQRQIIANVTAIATEQSVRASADSIIQSNLNTEISERKATDVQLQTDINTEQGRITSEISRATNAENALNTAKVGKETLPSAISGAKLAATASSVSVEFSNTDTNTGGVTQSSVVMPVASSERMGLMSKETFATVVENASRLAALEGAAKRYPVYLPIEDVTQTQYQQAWENASGKPTGSTPADGDTLVNLNNNHAITYYVNAPVGQDPWIDRGVDTVNPATNDVAGMVKGDAITPGKVFVESDTSMSVVGWDEMSAQTTANKDKAAALEKDKANNSDLHSVAKSGNYSELNGLPQAGTNIEFKNGYINCTYKLNIATTSTLGGVIPDGTTIGVDAAGRISVLSATTTWGHILGSVTDQAEVGSANGLATLDENSELSQNQIPSHIDCGLITDPVD